MSKWPPPQPQDLQVQTDVPWVPPSWEQLVRDHSTGVYRLADRLTDNPQVAEDLTQDVFVRVSDPATSASASRRLRRR